MKALFIKTCVMVLDVLKKTVYIYGYIEFQQMFECLWLVVSVSRELLKVSHTDS